MENLKVDFSGLKDELEIDDLDPTMVNYNVNILIAETLLQKGNIFTIDEDYGIGGDPDDNEKFENAGFEIQEDCDPNVIIPSGTQLKVTRSYFYENGYMDFGGCNVEIIGFENLGDFDFEIWGYCENYNLEDFCTLLNLDFNNIYSQLQSIF